MYVAAAVFLEEYYTCTDVLQTHSAFEPALRRIYVTEVSFTYKVIFSHRVSFTFKWTSFPGRVLAETCAESNKRALSWLEKCWTFYW